MGRWGINRSKTVKEVREFPFVRELLMDYEDSNTTIASLHKKYNITRAKLDSILLKNNVHKRPQSEVVKALWASGLRKKTNPNKSGTKNIFGAFFHRWRANATCRNMCFEITKDEIQALYEKQNGLCAYTQMPLLSPTLYSEAIASRRNPYLISLDRIDSKKGYTNGNCQLVCWWVNKAKGDMDDTVFRNVLHDLKMSWINK